MAIPLNFERAADPGSPVGEHRRKRPRYRRMLHALAAAVGATIVVWDCRQPEPLVAAFMISAVLGFLITLRLGRYVWGLILSDEVGWDRFPLENWLPVKGRWLRLLVLGPLSLLYLGIYWGAVSLLLGFAVISIGMLARILVGG